MKKIEMIVRKEKKEKFLKQYVNNDITKKEIENIKDGWINSKKFKGYEIVFFQVINIYWRKE